MAAFTSAFALCPQATHTKVAWLLRLSDAMCLQGLQVCDVYAALTFSTLPGAFCSSRVTRSPQPDLRMPRLSPVFCATFLPGFSMVPRAERVMPLHVEVLDPDHIKPAGEVGGGLLGPVFAPAAIFGFQPCDQSLHLVAAVGPAGCAGESALQQHGPAGFLQAQPARTGHLTRGQRPRDSDTPVPPDDATGPRRRDRFGDHSQRDMPTPPPGPA